MRGLQDVEQADCPQLLPASPHDMLDQLTGSTIFTCLDMQSAYHQVMLCPEDVPKTAFMIAQGLFEYRVLPFGLRNAPGTFQSLMNCVKRKERLRLAA